ncbi:MAG TPA: hypothetical protein VEL11_18945 [Candidatus Bathyarchaeia archaeon]|nr:hypothetical protein [Candidatus Bathyarchaeia archaeon]
MNHKNGSETSEISCRQSNVLDNRLAILTGHQYIIHLKKFFDSLKLCGTLDEQSREFLTRTKRDDKGKEWARNGLKYFIREKKHSRQ